MHGFALSLISLRDATWKSTLTGVCDDIAMRYHDTFGQSRSAAGVAEERSPLCAIARSPIQWFQAIELFTLANEVVHGLHALGATFAASELSRQLEYVYAVVWDPALLGRLARSFEQ
jgi:hypothetical protein